MIAAPITILLRLQPSKQNFPRHYPLVTSTACDSKILKYAKKCAALVAQRMHFRPSEEEVLMIENAHSSIILLGLKNVQLFGFSCPNINNFLRLKFRGIWHPCNFVRYVDFFNATIAVLIKLIPKLINSAYLLA